MNHRILLPTLFFSLALGACAQKKSTVSPAPTAQPTRTDQAPRTTKQPTAPRFGGVAKADSLFFYMERTPCFGQCKAFRINVYRSGYATFEGRANVEREGMHRSRVGKDTMEILMREAEKIKFFELKDKYDSDVTDLPSAVIRIVGNGKDKQVIGRVGTPESFRAFFTKAEELLFPLPWWPIPPQE